jgi:ADP-ribose pyrophosphatase
VKNRVLSSTKVYNGKIINLRVDEVELPDGRHTIREVIEHPGACVIVPVDEQGRVHLVRQYRDAAGREMLELPAGKLKPGEEPLDCARREFREELGLLAAEWRHLASFYSSPGFCDEILHAFLATGLSREEEETPREAFVEAETRPLEPLPELLAELKDGKSIAGVLLAARELSGNKKEI